MCCLNLDLAVYAFIGFVTDSVKEIKKETLDKTRKGGRGCRVPKYRSWKNPRANRPYSRGINKIRLDGDEWFRTSTEAGQEPSLPRIRLIL